MWRSIVNGLTQLLVQPHCPICGQMLDECRQGNAPCPRCQATLQLPSQALEGAVPLPWIAAGHYSGQLRRLLLSRRRRCNLTLISSLSFSLRTALPANAILVPIPSWKKAKRSNPLPALLTKALERREARLLKRCRAVVGQHHLNQKQRWQNQHQSFDVNDEALRDQRLDRTRDQVWLVDDIITTGATVLDAARTLEQAGFCVSGAACLARTPAKPRSDLQLSRR